MGHCKLSLSCDEVEQRVPWFLDDELDVEQSREMEEHLGACASCQRMLESEGQLRLALRRAADSMTAPTRLRRRLNETLKAERKPTTTWSRRWPAAAAAAVLAVLAWRGTQGSARDLDEAASRHARNLPMDVVAADVSQVQRYLSGKLPFAVQLPSLEAEPANLGGRVTQLNNRDAAYVRYETPQGRVSVFVYQGDGDSLFDADAFEDDEGLRIGHRRVFLRRVRGYTAARWREGGLVYSLVTDMPERDLPRLLRMARQDPQGRPPLHQQPHSPDMHKIADPGD